VSQSTRRKGVELAAAFVAAALTSALAVGVQPAPQPLPVAATPLQGETFTAICSNAAQDTRADPAWVSASYEGDHCQAPVMPAVLNGRSATREEIVAGMQAAKRFAAQSDVFQKCVADFAAAHVAGNGPTAERAFRLVENHRIQVSEKNKKKAAVQIAAAIEAFNAFGSECPE
jgi:hypothetical protein